MARSSILLVFLVLLACTDQKTPPELPIDISKSIVSPKIYIVGKTDTPPIIDGKDLDACWELASFSEAFTDIEGIKTPEFETRIKMVWDDDHLYLYAVLNEPHVWGNLTERDAIIYHNNDFEVFIDPEGKGGPYGEIEINALGTVWDLLLTKPYRVHGKPLFNWNIAGLQSAVHVSGSLNDPRDIDKNWSVEMAIPMESLTELISRKYKVPNEGDQWRINFSRVQWEHEIKDDVYTRKKENGKLKSENNWVWSPQLVINMHEPEKWGYLQFTEEATTEHIEFKRDEDWLNKQVLFAVFRQIHFKQHKLTNESIPGEIIRIKASYENGKHLDIDFFKTNSGFEILLKKDRNGSLLIDQEGKLKLLR